MNPKLLAALAVGALCSTSAIAQSTYWPGKTTAQTPRAVRQEHHLKTLRSLTAGEAGSKTTATEQRLLASTMYYDMGNGLQLVDSARFKYGGVRTSKFGFEYLYYNEYLTLPSIIEEAVINYDTAAHYDPSMSQPPVITVTTRNAAGVPQSQGEPLNYAQAWIYDAQGKVTLASQLSYNGSSWDTSYRNYYAYDAQGRVVRDSAMTFNGAAWEPDSKQEYSYNSANQPTQVVTFYWNNNAFYPTDKADVTYAASTGFVPRTVISQFYTGTAWAPDSKDTFGYTNSMQTLNRSYEWFSNAWQLTMDEYRHLNSANLPDSVFSRFYDLSTNTSDSSASRHTYNTYRNPTLQRFYYSSNIGNTVPDYQNVYYYELFETSVPKVNRPQNLRIFPNPATNAVAVKLDKSGKYACSILNAAGQMLMQFDGNVSAGQQVSVPVQQLAPGQYILQMQDEQGLRYTGKFIKQ